MKEGARSLAGGAVGARDPSTRNPGGTTHGEKSPSRSARVFVLLGPALALLATIFPLATGTGARFICGVWFCAFLWTFLTALALVLWRGFRYGDWSAFGRYAHLRDFEDHDLHEGDHGPGAWPP